MAKHKKRLGAGESKKGKFCIVIGHIHEEQARMVWGRPICYRTARQAKAMYRAAIRENDGWDTDVKLCRRNGRPLVIRRAARRVKLTNREKRRAAAARAWEDRNLTVLPF